MNIHRLIIDSNNMIDFTDKEIKKYCGMTGHAIANYMRGNKLTGINAIEELKKIAKENKYIVMLDYIKG